MFREDGEPRLDRGHLREHEASTFISSIDRVDLGWLRPDIIPKRAVEMRMKSCKFSEDKIKNRLALGNEKGDFWDNLLKVKDDRDRGMSVDEMTANASNIVLGGSETTATLLSGCVYMLLLYPHVMEKVMAELRQHFTSSDEIDLFTVSRLTYTLAVLEETMRICPSCTNTGAACGPSGRRYSRRRISPRGNQDHYIPVRRQTSGVKLQTPRGVHL